MYDPKVGPIGQGVQDEDVFSENAGKWWCFENDANL